MKALFLKTAGTPAAPYTDAPLVCIVQGETGYRPVVVTPEVADELLDVLNEQTVVPPDVARSAINASMFGWDTRAAAIANDWFTYRGEWDDNLLPKDPQLAELLLRVMRRK